MKPGPVNFPIAIASLLLSVMLWLTVYGQSLQTPDSVDAKISVEGLDEGQMFIRTIDPAFHLQVRGTDEQIRAIKEEKPTAFVDLRRAKAGTARYPVSIKPDWVQKLATNERMTVSVTLEDVIRKRVPVVIDGKGQMRDPSYTLNQQRVTPDYVTVEGPDSEVNKVDHARAYLDLSEIIPLDSRPQSATLVALDTNNTQPPHVQVTPSTAAITFAVMAAPTVKTVTIQPDFRGLPAPGWLPNGWDSEPHQVVLNGKSLTLAAVSSVTTEPIDVSGVERTQSFRVRLRLPVGTHVVGRNTVIVTYRVVSDPSFRVAPPRRSNPDAFPDKVPPLESGTGIPRKAVPGVPD